MGRTSRWMIPLFAVVLFAMPMPVLAGSIEGLAPAEALAESAKTMADLAGYHIQTDLQVTMGEMGMDMAITGEQVIQKDGINYTSLEFGGMAIESYQKGDNIVMRNPMTGEWSSSDEMGVGMMPGGAMGGGNPMDQMDRMVKLAKNAKWCDDDKVGEVRCKVLEIVPDPKDLEDLMGDQIPAGAPVDLNSAKVSWKIWLGVTDGYTYKMQMDMSLSIAGMDGMMGDESDEDEDEGDDLTSEEDEEDEDDDADEDSDEDEGSEEAPMLTVQGSFEFSQHGTTVSLEVPEEVMDMLQGGRHDDGDDMSDE